MIPGLREVKRQPSEYEKPVKKRSRNAAVKSTSDRANKETSPSDSNYDIPEGVQGLPLDQDNIQVRQQELDLWHVA